MLTMIYLKHRKFIAIGVCFLLLIGFVLLLNATVFKDPVPPILRAMYPYFHIDKLEGVDHYTFGNNDGFEFDFFAREVIFGDTPFFVVAENGPDGTSRYMFLAIMLDPEIVIEIEKVPKVSSAEEAFEQNIFHVDITGDGKDEAFVRTISEYGFLTYTILSEDNGSLKQIPIDSNFYSWTDTEYVGFEDGAVLFTHTPERNLEKPFFVRHIVVDDTLLDEQEAERRRSTEAFIVDLNDALEDPEWAPFARAFDENCEILPDSVLQPKGATFRSLVEAAEPVKVFSDDSKVYLVGCMLHAYQSSQMPVLYDGNTYSPLEMITLGEKGEEYKSYRAVELFYSPSHDIFGSYAKGRGMGDCGTDTEYKLIDKKLVLQKQESDWECDGEYESKTIYDVSI
jgi:hypothetical protein